MATSTLVLIFAAGSRSDRSLTRAHVHIMVGAYGLSDG
jgi:hypothetical protein